MVLHPSGHLYYPVSPRALFWGQFCSFSLKTICLLLNHQLSSYVLYRHIESSADHDKLQQDLLQLEEWAAMLQMNFAPSKCYIMSITLKRQPSSFSYTLCNTPARGSYVPEILRGLNHQLPQLDKAGCGGEKESEQNPRRQIQRKESSYNAVVKERAYLSLVRPVCE